MEVQKSSEYLPIVRKRLEDLSKQALDVESWGQPRRSPDYVHLNAEIING